MKHIRFNMVNLEYVDYLKNYELKHRGFSRVPDLDYGKSRKRKFMCGIVLKVKDIDYYVPVSSYKEQQNNNILIVIKNRVTSSLRFNYMFPIPKELIEPYNFSLEEDIKYRTLLKQEWLFCIKNQRKIEKLAEHTYKRVINGKDNKLKYNSCDFKLLEQALKEFKCSGIA